MGKKNLSQEAASLPSTVGQLVERNVEEVLAQFQKNPNTILVSVQIEDEQEAHLRSGLNKRSRRLIPITVLAKMLTDL